MNETSSPIDGDDGNVKVNAALVVLQKYPSPATAVKPEVLTACHDVPPDTSAKDKVPDPFVFKKLSADPSAFGKVNPSRTMFPEPFGVIVMLPLAASVI